MMVDFHLLRHSTATRLASQNVPLPVAMLIMRHSDPKLTAKAYVDQATLPLAASMALLRGMPNGKPLSPHSSLHLGGEGHLESLPVALKASESSSQVSVIEPLSRFVSQLEQWVKWLRR
jgi:hypothetical protein